jgi:hypothetical protein
MKAVTQRFGLSSSGCGRAAIDDTRRRGAVVPAAVAWMPGGGRRPVWVGLGRKGCWVELGCWGKRLFRAKMREKKKTGCIIEFRIYSKIRDSNQGDLIFSNQI